MRQVSQNKSLRWGSRGKRWLFYICCKDQNKIQRHNNKDQNKNHKGHTAGIKSMIANDKIINEPSAMANEFNGFFSKISKSRAIIKN